MKNVITLFVVATVATALYAQDLTNIRLLYKDATQSKENAEAFYAPLYNVTQTDNPVLVAYKGAGLTLLARYEKLTDRGPKVKEAVQWIEKAIATDPENVEIRLIRLSVQEHLPRFLKYNQDIEEDRKFVQQALPSVNDESLKSMINGYFEEFSTQ